MIRHRTPTQTDDTGERMTERIFMEGPDPMPLNDLLAYVVDAGGHLMGPDAVQVHAASFVWERDATQEERQRWREWREHQKKRSEEWEWETYVRLKRKFETIHYSDTEDMGS